MLNTVRFKAKSTQKDVYTPKQQLLGINSNRVNSKHTLQKSKVGQKNA